MDIVDELEKVFEKRRQYLCFNCHKVYFMADLIAGVNPTFDEDGEIEEYLDEKDLSEFKDRWFNFLEPCNKDWHYLGIENDFFGLAEYLDKDTEGIDKHDVPLISYEITDNNKCLFECYIRKELDPNSKVSYNLNGTHEEVTVRKALKKYLDGQIGDGWGENGQFVYHFFGCPALNVNVRNLREIRRKWDLETGNEYWEEVKDEI